MNEFMMGVISKVTSLILLTVMDTVNIYDLRRRGKTFAEMEWEHYTIGSLN